MFLLKKAFSLAEILVTLAIIGVIAALTIPALQQNANNAAIATNLKKIYSELNQVTANILAQNEVNKLSRTVYLDDEDTFYNEFVKKELNVISECDASSQEKCFGTTSLPVTRSFLLNSGIAISFLYTENSKESGVPVFVDVNGPKSPNKGGTDQFMLKMTNEGLVYTGQGSVSTKQATSTSNTCTSGTDDYALAWACAAKIQLDGWNVKY